MPLEELVLLCSFSISESSFLAVATMGSAISAASAREMALGI